MYCSLVSMLVGRKTGGSIMYPIRISVASSALTVLTTLRNLASAGGYSSATTILKGKKEGRLKVGLDSRLPRGICIDQLSSIGARYPIVNFRYGGG